MGCWRLLFLPSFARTQHVTKMILQSLQELQVVIIPGLTVSFLENSWYRSLHDSSLSLQRKSEMNEGQSFGLSMDRKT